MLAMTQPAYLQTACDTSHSQHLLYLDGQALEPLKKVTAGPVTVLSICKTQAASATLDQDQEKQLSHSVLKAIRTYKRDSSSASATHWPKSIHTFAIPAKTTPRRCSHCWSRQGGNIFSSRAWACTSSGTRVLQSIERCYFSPTKSQMA